MVKLKKWDKILIHWLDSSVNKSGWISVNEIDAELLEIKSCGFFLKKSKKSILIAESYYEDPDGNIVGEVLTIPYLAVIKVIKLCEIV